MRGPGRGSSLYSIIVCFHEICKSKILNFNSLIGQQLPSLTCPLLPIFPYVGQSMMLESFQDFCTGGPQAIFIYKFSFSVRHAANTLYSPFCIIFLKKELFPGFKSFRLHKTSRQGRLYGNMDTSYLSGRSCFTGLKAVARWVLKNAWCDQFPSVK